MASHTPAYRFTPLDVLLASVPSLPRAILARLTARMIERLDELNSDVDDEWEEHKWGGTTSIFTPVLSG